MAKFKVYEVADKTTASGHNLKKLVLQGEGKQYPDKMVTMWSDHPLWETIAPGQEIEGELEVKDSTVVNPHGGFYKNKTLLKPGQMPSKAVAAPQSPEMGPRVANQLEHAVLPKLQEILAKIDRIEKFVTGEVVQYEKGEAEIKAAVKPKLEDWEPRDLDGSPF